MDLSFQTILLDKTIVLFMYLEKPYCQVIAVRLGSYSHSDSSVFLFVFILAKSVFSTIAELIWSPTETQDQWHKLRSKGVCAEPHPLQKNPAVGLCQENCAATHSVCNPGIREVKGNLFIHFSRLWKRAWVPTLCCQRDYLSDGLLVYFFQEDWNNKFSLNPWNKKRSCKLVIYASPRENTFF